MGVQADPNRGPSVLSRRENWAIYLRLLREARSYWWHLAGALLLSFLAIPLALLVPLPLKIAVDSVLGSHPVPHLLQSVLPNAVMKSNTALLWVATGLMILITLLLQAESFSSWLLQTYLGEMMTLAFRARLFARAQQLSISYHDKNGTPDSLYRIQYDSTSIQNVVVSGTLPLITAAFKLCGMVAVMAAVDIKLALVALVVCPLLYTLIQSCSIRLRRRWREVKRLDSLAVAVVQEVLSVLRVVKAFGQEQREQERFVRRSRERIRRFMDAARMQGMFDFGVAILTATGSATVLFVGVRHVQSHIITLGELLIVMAYLAQIYEPLKTISKKVTDLQAWSVSAERAFTLLDNPVDVIERPTAKALGQAQGAIAFRDVTFSYEKDLPILHNISFQIPPGARVGIRGRTGAGKTTVVNLLMRFYDPESGEILLDGVDLRDYKLKDLRDQFALVLQEPVLFSTTVAENIAYGRPGAPLEDIMQAAKHANVHQFISSLPSGYQTQVGERGMRMSGGERQRLSLARAFLKNAPVLILDEPTSSVDVKTESSIMDAIERLVHGRTSFIIAHRVSTLSGCDYVLNFDHGHLISFEHQVREVAG